MSAIKPIATAESLLNHSSSRMDTIAKRVVSRKAHESVACSAHSFTAIWRHPCLEESNEKRA